jgi:hypothetical protein
MRRSLGSLTGEGLESARSHSRAPGIGFSSNAENVLHHATALAQGLSALEHHRKIPHHNATLYPDPDNLKQLGRSLVTLAQFACYDLLQDAATNLCRNERAAIRVAPEDWVRLKPFAAL